MKPKKNSISTCYEEAYKEHMKQHKENVERAGLKIILEK